MKDSVNEALKHLYGVGKACKQCGWDDEQILWCTDTHKIKVKHLILLKGLIQSEHNKSGVTVLPPIPYIDET